MTREQIIKALSGSIDSMITNKRTMIHISGPMAENVLELLKKQEPKLMTEYDDGWNCPSCGLRLFGKTASGYPYSLFDIDLSDDEIVKYCPICGQEVKWDG